MLHVLGYVILIVCVVLLFAVDLPRGKWGWVVFDVCAMVGACYTIAVT